MALLLEEPRHANVIAMEEVTTLTLNREQFVQLLGPLRDLLDRQMRIRVLKSVPLLSSLSDDELDTIAHALRVVVYSDGDVIIQHGEEVQYSTVQYSRVSHEQYKKIAFREVFVFFFSYI